jgi:hypothetical protein
MPFGASEFILLLRAPLPSHEAIAQLPTPSDPRRFVYPLKQRMLGSDAFSWDSGYRLEQVGC